VGFVALGTLSGRQRGIVERHLALVHLTLRRHEGLCSGRAGRERSELFQEGCLALAEAVRSHDAARHGAFPPFAMARIHFAVSSFAHEQSGPIRIPFITQRRERERGRRRPEAATDSAARVIRISGEDGLLERAAARRGARPGSSEHDERPAAGEDHATVGDLVRDQIDRAAVEVATEMRAIGRGPGHATVVDRCLEERWAIPEPECRTPIRRLARSLECSIGKITHNEERFRRKMAESLEGDVTFQALERLAKSHPAGFQRKLSAREVEKVKRRTAARDKSDPR